MMVSPYVRIFDFVIGLCLGLLFNRLQGMRERWFDVPPLHRARNRVARVSRRAVPIDVAKVTDAGEQRLLSTGDGRDHSRVRRAGADLRASHTAAHISHNDGIRVIDSDIPASAPWNLSARIAQPS
jgi:hypothetical protein